MIAAWIRLPGQADTCAAPVIVVIFQVGYCERKARHTRCAKDRAQLRTLISWGCALGLLGLLFMVLFLVFQRYAGLQRYAYTMEALCKGASVLSIWTFEVQKSARGLESY